MFLQEFVYGSQRIQHLMIPASCSTLQRLCLISCYGTGEAGPSRNEFCKQKSPGLHICCAAALDQLALSFEHCSEAQSCCNGGLSSRVLHILLAEHLPPATPAEAPSSQARLAAVPHAWDSCIWSPSGSLPQDWASILLLHAQEGMARPSWNPRWLPGCSDRSLTAVALTQWLLVRSYLR